MPALRYSWHATPDERQHHSPPALLISIRIFDSYSGPDVERCEKNSRPRSGRISAFYDRTKHIAAGAMAMCATTKSAVFRECQYEVRGRQPNASPGISQTL
jgi:hypothetical protein